MSGVIPFIRNLNSPVLAANLILDKVPELRKETNLHDSIVISINGTKIGIIGYLTPETKYLAPRNGVEYEEEVFAIRREVKKLKNQGVKILIALGHSGFLKDIEIAKQIEDIDLVIGGHSNTFLWNSNSTIEIPEIPQGPYPTIIKHPSGKEVHVVQAYAYTKYLGNLHLIFDSEGEIVKYDGEPVLLNQTVPEDPELLAIVNKYQTSVGRINSEVVGTSLVILNGEQCRLRECNIGNLITTAMLNYTKEYHSAQYPNVNIAIVQGGRIRASIDHGKEPFNLTRGDLITVLPFSDTLTIVSMNGSVLKQSLEHSVATWRTIDSTGQFLQFAGMEVSYDLARPPGSRLVKAKAVCSNCEQSKPVDVKDYYEYEVMMPTFLGEGGDGYITFDNLRKEILTYNEVECVMDYLKKYSPVNPKLSGRIVILNENKIETPEVMKVVSKPENSSSSSLALIINKTLYLYYVICILIIHKYMN